MTWQNKSCDFKNSNLQHLKNKFVQGSKQQILKFKNMFVVYAPQQRGSEPVLFIARR